MYTIIGLISSFVWVFLIIGIASVLLKNQWVNASITRKIVHIGVSHWWIIAWSFFDHWIYASIPPVAFILINIYSYQKRVFRAMEHEDKRRNLGTIYFPIALWLLVMGCYAWDIPLFVGAIAILILGYGDGLASIVGEHIKSRSFRIFGSTKSIAGSLAMFFSSALVVVIILLVWVPSWGLIPILLVSLQTACVATAIEAITPWGLDNLTIPIGTTLFFMGGVLSWI
jgi:phytol kinase